MTIFPTVSEWIRQHFRTGDYKIVQLAQNATVGRITQLTTQSTEQIHPVRPIEERIKKLKEKADRKRQRPPVTRSRGKPRKPTG